MRLTCPSKSAFEFQAQAHLALLDYTQKPIIYIFGNQRNISLLLIDCITPDLFISGFET